MMLKEFRIDLHVHTCLSPCADLTMLPGAIVERAKKRDLDGIGICDHNSTENVAAVRKAGDKEGLQVLGGIEITSREEVHLMGFFGSDDALGKMQGLVYENLPGKNNLDVFGEQVVVDENDKVIDSNTRLLMGATNLAIDEVVRLIHDLEGLAIASHVDREGFGIIGQLGFIPPELPLDALGLSARCNAGDAEGYKSHGLPLVRSSDAHLPGDIGKAYSRFLLDTFSFREIVMAFGNIDGRKVEV